MAKNETADDIYQYDYLKIRDKYSVYFGGNQSLVEVNTLERKKSLSERQMFNYEVF